MKKRLIAMLLLSVLTLSSLTGCSSGSSTASAAAGSGSSDESDATASDGAVEVEFWYAGGKTAVNVVQEIVDEFNASQDTYYVTTVTQADYTETYEKLQAAIAGSVAPDLVLLGTSTARVLSDKSVLTDLTAYTEADEEYDRSDYIDAFFQGEDDNGKLFALPAYGTTQVLYYNIEAFEAADIDPESIGTWQDLAEAAQKIKDAGYDYGWEPMYGYQNLIDIAMSNGASVLSEDGTQVLINSEEWVEAWEAIRTWIHDDEIMTVHSGGQGWEYWYTTMDDALNGVAGGYTGSSGDQADLDFSVVGAIEQPAFDEDSESAPLAEALVLSVLKSSGDAEKQGAYEFIRYFTSTSSQTKWTMATGYVPVRTDMDEDEDYQAYVAENPQAAVPVSQATHGSIYPYDSTGGEIVDALSIAADKVELEGISAQEALDEAQATAQAALDEALGQ
ncbi:MAG: ABC transporter substrate-binding protein [Lachnospiraceae bacterium]|nr:ABC transporter substrate-binding protein [Lachnospiraceae bacterium]